MITGTNIGASSNAINSGLSVELRRVRPSAASVPSGVASAVVALATTTLLRNALLQPDEPISSSYQRSEKPAMGEDRNERELNDSGMIARIGKTRNAST